MSKKPLEGIKVADFSWSIVGPLTTKALADCGAEVIRIESKSRPGIFRSVPPFKDGTVGFNRGGNFNQFNTCKRSVTLNLAHPKGLEVAKRLVAWADVVVETFAGGIMVKMGLGYEELKKVKSDIIMLSSSMMGQTGPHATRTGFGHMLVAWAGYNQIAGWPDHEPRGLGSLPITDFIAPHFNVLIILAALDYRDRTGKGQYIDMSQYETGIYFLEPLLLDYNVNQRVANRVGNRSTYAAPHGAYCCCGEDRWCAIAIYTNKEWESFCQVIGNPAWSNDPKFATLLARKENEEELDRLIEEWTINHSAEEVMSMMQAAGVAAGMLETGEDLLEHDPQLRHRHYFWELDHPEVGKYMAYRPSFLLSKSPYELWSAPLLGEHTEYVLKEVLGMSDEEIAELAIEGGID